MAVTLSWKHEKCKRELIMVAREFLSAIQHEIAGRAAVPSSRGAGLAWTPPAQASPRDRACRWRSLSSRSLLEIATPLPLRAETDASARNPLRRPRRCCLQSSMHGMVLVAAVAEAQEDRARTHTAACSYRSARSRARRQGKARI